MRAVDRRGMGDTLSRPVLLSVLVAWLILGSLQPVRGQSAAGDPFTVTGVSVDVTAANAAAARDRAIAEAQRKAFATLYQRLSPGAGTAPAITDVQLQRLVRGFEVEQERVAPDRYAANLSVTFRADAVRAFFGEQGSAMAEPRAKPYVVLPVLQGPRPVLWEERTEWRTAWEDRAQTGGAVPVVVPLGELADVSAVSVDEALAGSAEALDRIERKYGADGALVATFVPPTATGGASVRLVLYDDGRPVDKGTVAAGPVPAGADTAGYYSKVVGEVMGLLERAWKTGSMNPAPEVEYLVAAELSNLSQWVELRRRLQRQGRVTGVRVVSLTRRRADLTLRFRGDADQLRTAMAEVGLEAVPGAGGFNLLLGSTPAAGGSPGALPLQSPQSIPTGLPPPAVPVQVQPLGTPAAAGPLR